MCIGVMCGDIEMKRRSKFYSGSRVNTEKEEKQLYDYMVENCSDDKTLSRYRVEGVLLYEFQLSHSKMYRVVMNMVNEGIISLINKSDGEYYKIEKMGVYQK